MMNEPLFKSADDALRFAFCYSGQSYDRPTMNRMADGPHRAGKGLVGLDGAAQAGLIRSELKSLGGFVLSIITASYAPTTYPCECGSACCSGQRVNLEWAEAITAITQAAAGRVSCGSNMRLRRTIVANCFLRKGERKPIGDMADYCGVHRDTASDHNAKIALWLLGMRGKEAITGEIEKAKDAAHRALIDAGFVGYLDVA
ncbi:MAG: hypothetical protein WBK19_10480 [Azonexus sp.]